MPENCKGADVLIPVKNAGSSPSASKYSILLVQFKNRDQDAHYPDSATSKLSSEYDFAKEKKCHNEWKDIGCIRVYMHLGADTPRTAAHPLVKSSNMQVPESSYALAAFGLSSQVYPCLDSKDEDLDVGSADAEIDICAHMQRFLKPP